MGLAVSEAKGLAQKGGKGVLIEVRTHEGVFFTSVAGREEGQAVWQELLCLYLLRQAFNLTSVIFTSLLFSSLGM